MVRKVKTAVVIFTINQLRKLLEILYTIETPKDKKTLKIIRHLQNTLYEYTGCWWV